MARLKTLTLADWNATYGDNIAAGLYVVNNAKAAMDIIFNVKDAGGNSAAIMVPNTEAPIDLTSFTTLANLVQSPDFKRLLNNNILVIVDNKQVEDLRKNDPQVDRMMSQAISMNGGAVTEVNATNSIELKIGGGTVQQDQEDDEPTIVELILEVSEDESANTAKLEEIFFKYRDKLTAEDKDQLLTTSKNDDLLNLLSEIM
jgi:hypothetical protein